MTNNIRVRQMKALYAELPTIDCKGLCHHSCQGIQFSDLEMHQMRKVSGMTVVGVRPGWVCPFLDLTTKRCKVHGKRPCGCRLWGCTERMQCKHGCIPSRLLTDEEEYYYIHKSMYIGGSATEAEWALDQEVLADPELFAIARQAMRSDVTGVSWDLAWKKIHRIREERIARG